MEDEKNGLFRISFDPAREQMITDFLQSVHNEPATFLLPHYQYHKRLKPSNIVSNGTADWDQMEVCNDLPKDTEFSEEYRDEVVERVRRKF